MDKLLKKLNSPKVVLAALALILLVNGFLFYYYRLSEPSDLTVEPPGSQLIEDAASISPSGDDETDSSEGEGVAPLEAVEAATNIPLPGTARFDEIDSSGSDSEESNSEEEGILGSGVPDAALALTPGFGTPTAPPAPVPEPANNEASIAREIAETVIAPVASVSPVGPASNEQPENQGLFETAAAALEPISQGSVPATPLPVPDFFVPAASSNEAPAPATSLPVPDFFIPPSNEAPVPATPLPVPDFFVPDSSSTELPAPLPAFPTPAPAPDSSFVEPVVPEATEDTSEPSPLPPVEQSPPPPSVGQPPPSDCQPTPSGSQEPLPSECPQPLPPPSESQQPAGYQQPLPSGSQQPAEYQQTPPSGAQ